MTQLQHYQQLQYEECIAIANFQAEGLRPVDLQPRDASQWPVWQVQLLFRAKAAPPAARVVPGSA